MIELTETLKITSIRDWGRLIAINGVPTDKTSYFRNSGKYIISINAPKSFFHIEPEVGQIIEVTGMRAIGLVSEEHNLERHLYKSPKSVELKLPADGESFQRFIANEKEFVGIGPSKAMALWQEFGFEIHTILKQRNEVHTERLRRILTDKSIETLYKGYEKYKNLEYSLYLSQIGVKQDIQHRIIKFHDESTVDAIKANPYRLLGFGMSFSDVHDLAKKHFDIKDDDERRLKAAVERAIRYYVLRGDTVVEPDKVMQYVNNSVLYSKKLAEQAIQLGCKDAQFIINPKTGNYHPLASLIQETVIAKRLIKLSKRPRSSFDAAYQKAVNELPYELTEQQDVAVKQSLENEVSCITGGAGTGKTTVLRTVLRAYNYAGFAIQAIALSGRAAMRMHESIGFETKTIARFLREPAIEPTEPNAQNVLVIDEASMIDVPTMYRIINHIHPSVRIIFVGDPAQLPPIGAGRVLSDVVESHKVNDTMLQIVKRQDATSMIPEFTAMIRDGIVPPQKTIGAITFHECSDADIADKCVELFCQSPGNSRVLSSTNKLVEAINKVCQSHLNPDAKGIIFEDKKHDVCLNDPVLFTSNNYMAGYQNGTLGLMTNVDLNENSLGQVTLDNNEVIEITPENLKDMELAYGVTVHKAQGSQFPRIIIALKKSSVVDRSWIYTAITRAEAEVHIVANSAYFEKKIKDLPRASLRKTYLKELLQTVKADAYE